MTASAALETPNAPGRVGYDASPGATVGRVLPLLSDEHVVWLSTVRPDGTPHLVPTWFWWDGEALVVYSKPDAVKARNLRANPRLMVAIGDPENDFAVGLIEAVAAFPGGPAHVPDGFFAKYATGLGPAGLDPATFREIYTETIRIVPMRYLSWHGRGVAHEGGTPAPAPATTVVRLRRRIAATVDELVIRLLGGSHRHLPIAA